MGCSVCDRQIVKLSTAGRIHRCEQEANANPLNPHITDITTLDQLEVAVSGSERRPVVLFKHSTACGLSQRAHQEIEELSLPTDPPVFRIIVQSSRPISDEIAHRFRIRHESPQVIVLLGGLPVFDSSHRGVTANKIRAAVAATA